VGKKVAQADERERKNSANKTSAHQHASLAKLFHPRWEPVHRVLELPTSKSVYFLT